MTPFATALGHIEFLLEVDPDRAREEFPAVLALATPTERGFLDQAADILTRSPYSVAARQLGWMAKSRPELRSMIIDYTADSNPGLHRPAMPDPTEVGLDAAEWVRRSIRDQHRRERVTATPAPATDAARLAPDAIAYRRARQPIPHAARSRVRDHDQHIRAWRARHDAEVTAYVADRLFTIDTIDAETALDRTPPVPDPRKPAHLLWGHVQAGLWDRTYFLHVAENYTERNRQQLTTPDTRDAATQDFLRAHDTTNPTGPDTRRAARQNPNAAPKKITPADQARFAATRTGLPIPTDYDELRPYTELDVPEPTWQGSGLDYDLAAMVSYLGWPCVGCWIDRPDRDRRPVHTRDRRRVSDDGLCDICRADGHPGIPPLPVPWGMGDYIASRCAYIATAHPAQARAILDRIRAAATNTGPTWRTITRWMAANLDKPATDRPTRRTTTGRRRPGALGAGQRIGRCDSCARPGVVHADNFCTDCRIALGLVGPRGRITSAA
ncbi:hypothetical protein [Nocardia sp. NPDC052566]|uniref:hypothetical protein n=1 Tax=Nocardia sp. NPDC052566 TaxID=3364330 RepID=UPI0037CA1F57